MPKLLLAFGQSESVSGSVSQALGRAFTELEAGADPRPESQLICVRRSAGDTIDELSVSLTELIDEMKAPGFFGALWLALGEDYDSYDSDPRYELSSSDPAGVARQLAAVFAEDSESLLNAHFLLANS